MNVNKNLKLYWSEHQTVRRIDGGVDFIAIRVQFSPKVEALLRQHLASLLLCRERVIGFVSDAGETVLVNREHILDEFSVTCVTIPVIILDIVRVVQDATVGATV